MNEQSKPPHPDEAPKPTTEPLTENGVALPSSVSVKDHAGNGTQVNVTVTMPQQQDASWTSFVPLPEKPKADPGPSQAQVFKKGIQHFFGYIFLMLACFLVILQALLFAFTAESAFSIGKKTLLFFITNGAIIAAAFMSNSDPKKDQLGVGIATIAVFVLSLSLMLMMAGFALLSNSNVHFGEYLLMITYMLALISYGLKSLNVY